MNVTRPSYCEEPLSRHDGPDALSGRQNLRSGRLRRGGPHLFGAFLRVPYAYDLAGLVRGVFLDGVETHLVTVGVMPQRQHPSAQAAPDAAVWLIKASRRAASASIAALSGTEPPVNDAAIRK